MPIIPTFDVNVPVAGPGPAPTADPSAFAAPGAALAQGAARVEGVAQQFAFFTGLGGKNKADSGHGSGGCQPDQ